MGFYVDAPCHSVGDKLIGEAQVSRSTWDASAISNQSGRVAVITGANSGLGLETALALARCNAHVVLACRDPVRASAAADTIRRRTERGSVETVIVNLCDFDSIHSAAQGLLARYSRIDLLINNAGIATPPHSVTAQGVEMQMAVNHLGHFAWTGLLLDRILQTPDSRVVSLSSLAHYLARALPEGLRGDSGHHRPFIAYAQSKLANLLFVHELQRRLQRAGASTIATAAHPGGARTELIRSPMVGLSPSFVRRFAQLQSAEMGALPSLRAACDPQARGGDYFGPDGFMQLGGHPVRVASSRRARDPGLQSQLWRDSEAITKVFYPV